MIIQIADDEFVNLAQVKAVYYDEEDGGRLVAVVSWAHGGQGEIDGPAAHALRAALRHHGLDYRKHGQAAVERTERLRVFRMDATSGPHDILMHAPDED